MAFTTKNRPAHPTWVPPAFAGHPTDSNPLNFARFLASLPPVKRFRRYFVPACLVAALFSIVFFLWATPTTARPSSGATEDEPVLMGLPHGRVLYVLVDEKAIFVGDAAIPLGTFDQFLRDHAATLRPDYAIVLGTERARYGHVVAAYAAIRHILAIQETIVTRPVAISTHHRAIEVHRHFWEYDEGEE